jgi:4-diphosphocytidyl-2-C-methyl-D-erythritol kinase
MSPLVLHAHAKVNVGLRVLQRRPDGYHDIHTVFQELELHDTLTLTPRPDGCSLTVDVDWVPTDETNLCVRAYRVLRERFPDLGGVKICLEKVIPAGAGLGGGSSDGATVLKGLTRLYRLKLSDTALETLAQEVGADVPFFIRGGTQIGDGTGNRLTPAPHAVPGVYLLVVPDVFISTAWAYRTLKKGLEASQEGPNFARFFQSDQPDFSIFENDFERIVIPAHPEIGVVKERLLQAGARFASLSGSGSTVFGIFDDEAGARLAESSFHPPLRTFLTFPTQP